MTPLERLQQLCDPGSLVPIEAPSNGNGRAARRDGRTGVIAAAGRVERRPVLAYAQDSSVAGGSVGEAEAALVVEVLRRGRQADVPVVGFIESAGARLQEGVAALGAYGRIFYENVALSRRVPQISVITGTAAGGGCYSPALTDFVIMTKDSNMFLTGPGVVREAVHEDVTADRLGGSRVHERNGVCQFVAPDERGATSLARDLLGYLPLSASHPPPVAAPTPPPSRDPSAGVPFAQRSVYDVRAVIRALVDAGRFLEVSAKWGRNIVIGFARLEGRTVGLVANQPRVIGGVLDAIGSSKAAGFTTLCADFGVPLVVLVDTPGFMPGVKQEAAGVIRQGATLVHAFAAAGVPRATVILRKAYGGAYIAMNSKSLGADLVVAWRHAQIGVMGARAAAQVIHRREIAAALDPEVQLEHLARAYARGHLSASAAARRGMIDAVIDPRSTREVLIAAFDRCSACDARTDDLSVVRSARAPAGL